MLNNSQWHCTVYSRLFFDFGNTMTWGLSKLARFAATAYIAQSDFLQGLKKCASSLKSIGPSMQPTFNVRGDVLFTEYLSPRLKRIKAGDVIVAVKPTDPRVMVLKRVRGMGGETIWVHPKSEAHPIQIVVPDGHVWLEGDNAAQSTDSREYGPVPMALVRGRVVLRFWPLAQAGFVRSKVIDHTAETRARPSWFVSGYEADCEEEQSERPQKAGSVIRRKF
eukprot:IDg6451t1